MTFDDILNTGWDDHADRPSEVVAGLATSLHLIETADQCARAARLLAHVHGEHLGQWQQGIEALESLRAVPVAAGAPASAVLVRSIATLRHASGAPGALVGLSPEDRVAVLADVASALAGRGDHRAALGRYTDAMTLADAGLPEGSPAHRALAVGGNNLAAALEEKPDRDAFETAGMVDAARGALRFWTLAGGWLEHERAHYRLAHSLLQAGDPTAAARSAQDGIEVCQRHGAPAFEQFFLHAVKGIAQRAAGDMPAFEASRRHVRELHAGIAEGERLWCAAELKELEG